jgi:hypothetical protein
MSDARRSHTRAIIAFVAIVGSIGAAFGACTSYQRANGEDCLKDNDCLSGYCLAQYCGLPPPSLDTSNYEDGSTPPEAAATPREASTPASDSSSASDSSGGGDSGGDGPAASPDSGHESDASDSGHESDAALDATGSTDASGGDANGSNDANGADDAEMDASDSPFDAGSEDANPEDGGPDAFNVVMNDRAFVV